MLWIKTNRTPARLFWVRLLMLVSFVLGQTPLLPAGMAVALMMEGSHAVELQGGGKQCQLKLHHAVEAGTSGQFQQKHEHGWISELMVPCSDSGPHPDHVISLSVESVEKLEWLVESGLQRLLQAPVWVPVECYFRDECWGEGFRQPCAEAPWAVAAGQWPGLRTMVMRV